MPSNVAARMTLAADPDSLHGAVAAGILGAGPVVLGTSEACALWLEEMRSTPLDPVEWVRGLRDAGARVPGFGHPVHRPVDPRAERILELADERGASGEHVALARRVRDVVAEEYGKPLPMNVSLPIAAVMLDLGFPDRRRQGGADPRADGEPPRPPGRGAGAAARLPAGGRGGRDGRVRARCSSLRSRAGPGTSSSPSTTRRSGHSSRTSASARRSTARSSPERRTSASAEIAQLPLTDKSELKATATAESPFGAQLACEPSEIVRIYSTSGTTGVPTYIPLTAADFENWVTGSARSYAASGVVAGAADRHDLQRRPVRRRSGAHRLRAHRPLPRPGRDGEHRAPAARHRAARSPRRPC